MTQLIDKLAFIYIVDKKVLMTMSQGKSTWYIPGGKREADESDHQALIREMKEETTVDLITDSLVHYDTFEAQAHGKPEGTIVRMTCYSGIFNGEPKPSEEIEKVGYFGYEIYESIGPVDKLIFDDLKVKGLIE